MNSRCNDNDESSFDGLMAFDTVPPPPGTGPADVHSARTTIAELPDSFLESLKSGVKAEATTRASGMTVKYSPPVAREEPEEPDEITQTDLLAVTRRAHAFELPEAPTSPYATRLIAPNVASAPRPVASRPVAPAPELFDSAPAAVVDSSSPPANLASAMAAALATTPRQRDAPLRLDAPQLDAPAPAPVSSPPVSFAGSPTVPPAVVLDFAPDVAPLAVRPRPLGLRDLMMTVAAVLTVSVTAAFMWALLFRYLR